MLTLIIFVAVGDAGDATSQAMARATRSVLGAQSHVELREAPRPPSDGEALAIEQQAHADAVAELTWDAAHGEAVLHVHVARLGHWTDRTIGFQASDADVERGRTIGFALASMLPEGGAGDASATTTTTTATTAAPGPGTTTPSGEPRPTPGAPAGGPPPPPSSAGATPAATSASTSTSTPAPVPRTADSGEAIEPGAQTRAPHRFGAFMLDVLAVGALAIGGDADGLGASAGLQWSPQERLAVRIGMGARGGSVQSAQSTTLALLGTAGVVLYPLLPSATRPVGVWVRADYVLEHQSMTHFSLDDPRPVTFDRWMSGADAVAGVDVRFAREVSLIAGLGLEDVFSPTYVQVRGVTVATLPPVRAVAETGFRLRF